MSSAGPERAQEPPAGPGGLSASERHDYELGRRCFERGDWEGALEALQRFLESRGDYADVHYMVGALLDHAGQLGAVAERLRESLRLNPSYTEAMVALSSVYERMGDFDGSRALAERVARLAVPSAGALDATTRGKLANLEAELADAYREVGELADAIEGYRRALDRCPTFHDIRYRLAIALREAGLPDRALAELERVRRGNPHFLDAAVQRGVTLYSLGRSEDAADAWQEVLDRDPLRTDAQMYLRMVQTGD